MKEALLTITTKQEGAEEAVSFTTRSAYDETDAGLQLRYEESLSEEDAVQTRLLIGEDSIMVEREGDTGGDMFFRSATTYETQYRAMPGLGLSMRIFTTNLDIARDEKGVQASVGYQLFLGGSSVGSMGMDIRVEYL
ncbi:MAG: DUF1934 domain-containing protein [Clostridia bacterium]|nr:DUF1934 domain-containing protein [Clostridia bacterium]